jgi:hypothetical protein
MQKSRINWEPDLPPYNRKNKDGAGAEFNEAGG